MARKHPELFVHVNNEKEFQLLLHENRDRLICAEVYCSFVDSCTALNKLFNTIKLDWSDNEIVLLKLLADEIKALERFHGQSEPFYMFIVNKKVTKVFRGVDGIRFAEVAKNEIRYFQMQKSGVCLDRPTYDIWEATPDEKDWLERHAADILEEENYLSSRRSARQAARKRHRAEQMIQHLQHLNFVLFWPHATHAHPELYERWNLNNIIMVDREEIELTKDLAEDILYAGDAPINEASLHALLSGPALVICFRLLDTDKHFVSLVRKILYEEMQNDDVPIDEQATAFDKYKSYSLTREEIYKRKIAAKERKKSKSTLDLDLESLKASLIKAAADIEMDLVRIAIDDWPCKLKEEIKEKRVRRLSEMQRLAREAIEEAIQAKRTEREQKKLELLKSGNLVAYHKYREESIDEETGITIPEELSDEEVEESSDDENEYLPPPGLLVPGFYAPPNDVAKVNGLAIVFPKVVQQYTVPLPEFLPPHVLVLLAIEKRYKAIKIMSKYKSAIIHMGVFKTITVYDGVHIAYSVSQYDNLTKIDPQEEVKLAFMLSVKTDFPLLELMDLNPMHVSRNTEYGEEECAFLFPINYSDNYPEFEDFK